MFVKPARTSLTEEAEERVFEANKEKIPSDLFTLCMNSWYEYVNAWNNMYTEFIKTHQRWLNIG
jgi:hypothetical protein